MPLQNLNTPPTEVTRLASSTDGRVARGERTRDAITDALYALIHDGVESPSGREIAERAEVSLRSVFQHFDDIEAVYAELMARQESRITPFLAELDPALPLSERVDRVVEMRDSMFALAAPLRRSAGAHRAARTSHTVKRGLLQLQRAQREQLNITFSQEIGDNDHLLLQVDIWLSFETWDQFLNQHGLSRAATRGHLQSLLMTLLSA